MNAISTGVLSGQGRTKDQKATGAASVASTLVIILRGIQKETNTRQAQVVTLFKNTTRIHRVGEIC
jgi:hypothetical protein